MQLEAIKDLGKDLFDEFEKGEVYGKILDHVTSRHPEDSKEFWYELRVCLGYVVQQMLCVMCEQLDTGDTVAAKLEAGQVIAIKSDEVLDSKVVINLFERARRQRELKKDKLAPVTTERGVE